MSSTGKIVIGVIAVVVVVVGAYLVYDAFLGETEAASAPISAAPIELETAAPEAEEPAEAPYPADSGSNQTAGDTSPYPAEGEALAAGGVTVFTIIPEESEASFSLGEILRGAPKTVVGVTDQVAGELAVDVSDLGTAEVGEVRINARTLVTDSDNRNRAIRNRILFTDSYEFITFTPTSVNGLSGSAAVGDTLTFEIEGDLTIRDTTLPVVFETTATLVADDRVEGTASTVVAHADFGLVIPSVQSVADVDEEVTLAIDFVAVPK